jgi:hypothetical protein
MTAVASKCRAFRHGSSCAQQAAGSDSQRRSAVARGTAAALDLRIVITRTYNRAYGYPCRTWTWQEQVARIEGFRGHALRPMRDFIAEVASSPYARALFPCASMDAVLIGRVPNFSSYEPHLRVWYNCRSRQFKFTYCADPASNERWETQAPAGRAYAHFEHLMLRRLRWFRPAMAWSNKTMEPTR